MLSRRLHLAGITGTGRRMRMFQEEAPLPPALVPEIVQRRPQRLVLFDRLSVRDTRNYYSSEIPGALYLPGMASWGFEIDNQCNQTVTWQIIGGSYPGPTTMGLVGASGSIGATTLEPIATDLYLQYLSLRINYATAPTSGQINVRAWADPR